MTRPADGVQLMKPIGGHDDLLAHSTEERVFGTEMRSVIELADEAGVTAVVDAAMSDVALVVASTPGGDAQVELGHRGQVRVPMSAIRVEGRPRSSSQRSGTWAR